MKGIIATLISATSVFAFVPPGSVFVHETALRHTLGGWEPSPQAQAKTSFALDGWEPVAQAPQPTTTTDFSHATQTVAVAAPPVVVAGQLGVLATASLETTAVETTEPSAKALCVATVRSSFVQMGGNPRMNRNYNSVECIIP
mmetsp:Transcript_57/g.77  ORF Transcript_57/g.77 Transcript_57/m.77 type:complete len:143 (+) Transcript_57:26-454(+)